MLAELHADARRTDADGPVAGVVSVIVPVLRDEGARLCAAYRAYKAALEQSGRPVEMIYVLLPGTPEALAALDALRDAGEPLRIVVLGQGDEAAALQSGLQHASGDTLLTLPDHLQVEPEDLEPVMAALADCDMVVARRFPLAAPSTSDVQARVFHWLIRRLFGRTFSDLVCRVRACRREVFEEITGYGAQHHFLPLLAAERGFRLREVDVRPREEAPPRGSRWGVVLSRLRLTLDALALFVVLKFLRKPLRFFGSFGLPILLGGLVYTGALGVARVFFGVPLADRPALILGVLLIVLGIQIIALGLIGEIIIFASGKRIRDYTVERVL